MMLRQVQIFAVYFKHLAIPEEFLAYQVLLSDLNTLDVGALIGAEDVGHSMIVLFKRIGPLRSKAHQIRKMFFTNHYWNN